MFHNETYQYREPDEIRAEYETERLIAASQIILAVMDYHKARKMIAEKKVTFESYFDLPNHDQRVIRDGKTAWEWIKNPPRANGSGWTLEHCCELLGLRPQYIRDEYLKPSVYREYKRLCMGLGGAKTIDKNQNKGAENGQAKLTQEQAEQVRVDYSSGLWSYRSLAKKYGISDARIGDIVRRESYA